MKKGLVSISIRKETPERIIEMMKKTKLTEIEWGGDVHVPHGDIETAKRVGKLTREAGLNVSSYGSYYYCLPDSPNFDDVIASAVALETDLIRVWAGKTDHEEATQEEREAIYENLRIAVEKAAKHNITVATEFHRKSLTNSCEGTVEMLKNVPGLKTYWQPRVFGVLEDECNEIITLGKNIVNAHVGLSEGWTGVSLSTDPARVKKYIDTLNEYSDARAILLESGINADEKEFQINADVLINC